MVKKKGGVGRVVKVGGVVVGGFVEVLFWEFNEGDFVLVKVKGWLVWFV